VKTKFMALVVTEVFEKTKVKAKTKEINYAAIK
jgi:hypothetical protein